MAVESRDPANDDSLTGLFKEVLRKFLQVTDDLLPAMVRQYDRVNNLALVQPLIQLVDSDDLTYNRAPLANVPVMLFGGGTFFLSFHLPAGSLGWIKANDRDISLFLQGFANNRPNTMRMHSFEDAIFIPDIMTGYTIAGEDSQAAVIQNQTGTVRLSLNDTRIKLTAPMVEINASGAVSILSASLDHNGTDIGDTHTHPQANDSGGNTEQDTGPPQ